MTFSLDGFTTKSSLPSPHRPNRGLRCFGYSFWGRVKGKAKGYPTILGVPKKESHIVWFRACRVVPRFGQLCGPEIHAKPAWASHMGWSKPI